MPRPKKERGRPMKTENRYPPRTEATTPEELAQAMLSLPADHKWQYQKADVDTVYRCSECGREVYYPDTLYRDGRCEGCHDATA